MNKYMKILLCSIAVIYILSPLDAFPGPIDDAIIGIGTWYLVTRKKARKEINEITEKNERLRLPDENSN